MLCSPRCVSPRALPTLVQTPGAAPGGDMYIAVPSFFITARCWPNEPSGARKAVTGDGFSSSESDIATARATHRRAATQSCHAACRIWQAPWQLVNVRFYPLPTWGRCSPTWGHGRPACNPTPGSRRARATPTSPHPPPCAGFCGDHGFYTWLHTGRFCINYAEIRKICLEFSPPRCPRGRAFHR